ncbi:hypothetical protein JT05_00015 [Desulfosporosinus sp. Tol-M]|nr:hypothetical protein JT05_00015 [Desulfosporosinus sp. Tol-M]
MSTIRFQTVTDRPSHIQRIVYKLFEIGKTQAWLARQVKIAPRYLNDMLLGRRSLTLPVAYRIALTLSFDPEAYIKEVKEASQKK